MVKTLNIFIKIWSKSLLPVVISSRQMVPNSRDLAHPRQNIAKLPYLQTSIIRNFEEVILVLNNHKVEQLFLNTMLEFILT